MTVGINGAELIILIVLALLILGPEKLPDYARKMTQWIRQMRQMAEGAKNQFKEETGTDFDEIDWRRYDPRQYDPRRIIKEALAEPVQDMRSTAQEVWDHEAVREDLKTMDPRDLVRGKAGRPLRHRHRGPVPVVPGPPLWVLRPSPPERQR